MKKRKPTMAYDPALDPLPALARYGTHPETGARVVWVCAAYQGPRRFYQGTPYTLQGGDDQSTTLMEAYRPPTTRTIR